MPDVKHPTQQEIKEASEEALKANEVDPGPEPAIPEGAIVLTVEQQQSEAQIASLALQFFNKTQLTGAELDAANAVRGWLAIKAKGPGG